MQDTAAIAPARPAPLARLVALLGRAALDLLLPPRCLSCGEPVADPDSLCQPCWSRIDFIAEPWCACCGRPFDLSPDPVAAGSRCGACLAQPPAFDRARAVMVYAAASRDLVLPFKHADRMEAAPAFGLWLARAGAELLADADMIAPVPLHRRRLFLRRYNQAALLATATARAACRTGVRVAPLPAVNDLLVRRRATPIQGGLTRQGRARNVAGAFALRPRHRGRVRGARIVLVDDVFTTGATVAECTRVLRRAGAVRVDVLTLARVVHAVSLDLEDG